MSQPRPTAAWAIAAMPAVFVLIWSTGFIVARFGMPNAPPLTFLSMRYGLSLLCFVVWVQWTRVPWRRGSTPAAWPRDRQQWLHLAIVGVLVHAGYLGGVWAAVKSGIGAGTVALLVGLQPVLTAIWLTVGGRGASATSASAAALAPAPAPGEQPHRAARVSPLQWAGLALGLAGLVLVVWRKLGAGEITAWNLSLAVLALLSITAGTLYQKRFLAPCDVRSASAVQLAAALVVSLPLALLEAEPIRWGATVVGAMAWSVVVLTLGGSSLLYLLLQRGAATRVTSLLYLVPPCTTLMAWAIFGETLTAPMLAGMLLTAIGVALVVREPDPLPTSAPVSAPVSTAQPGPPSRPLRGERP